MEKENRQFKMISLFDGSGSFPLAASLCGIEPVAASEVEPFPIKVTRARFPNMKHYGDISKINGAELEPVDLITGGSPCQSLSQAGKRDGMSKKCLSCGHLVLATEESDICPECGGVMAYTRSGLFMEQIRIIKEMREADELRQLRMRGTVEHIRPRFMLWENVTGAFTSNKGEDFRAVLEETARIVDKTAIIPRPPKGKWNNAGLIMADGYSIAWRVLDSQFWGVPQRRRRIALVADFGGQCAGEILFKRNGLQRNFTESRHSWQSLTGCFTESTGEAGECGVNIPLDMTHANDVIREYKDGICQTLQHRMGTGGNQVPLTMQEKPKPLYIDTSHADDVVRIDEKVSALQARSYKGGNNVAIPVTMQAIGFDGYNQTITGNKTKSLECGQDFHHVPVTMQVRCGKEGGGKGALIQKDLSATLGTSNMQTLFQPIPIQDQAISNGSGHGLGVGNEDDPMYSLMSETQHGICVIEGNGSRPSHRGDGYKESDIMYTLNATEQHAVCYQDKIGPLCASDYKFPQQQQVEEDKCIVEEKVTYQTTTGPLMANSHPGSYSGQDAYNDMLVATEYIVRRLTPLECSRLQGLPDWWCDGIEVPEPTEEDLQFWREVFETHREIVTHAKNPKSDK